MSFLQDPRLPRCTLRKRDKLTWTSQPLLCGPGERHRSMEGSTSVREVLLPGKQCRLFRLNVISIKLCLEFLLTKWQLYFVDIRGHMCRHQFSGFGGVFFFF